MEHEVALDVRDDGQGFDLAKLCAQITVTAHANGNGHSPVSHANGLVGLSVSDGLRHPTASATSDRATPDGGVFSFGGASYYGSMGGQPLNAPVVGIAATPDGGGFGLVAMRQRIESLAGTLQVESEPGFGTGISACIPAASAEARS